MLARLTDYVTDLSNYTCTKIRFDDPRWHRAAEIPRGPGWYYIATSAPIRILQAQTLWASHYTDARGNQQQARNYDIRARANRHALGPAGLWSRKAVYSGYADKLNARAREHSFAHPGTGALALHKYPSLHHYTWKFCYVTLDGFLDPCPNARVVLNLGEQVWRAQYGWPILCNG